MMDEYPPDDSAAVELLEEIRDTLAECLVVGKEILESLEAEDEEDEE